jgi:hypothetical protein
MLEYVVSYMLSEEMRWKNMEGLNKDALMVRGRLVNRVKGKLSGS